MVFFPPHFKIYLRIQVQLWKGSPLCCKNIGTEKKITLITVTLITLITLITHRYWKENNFNYWTYLWGMKINVIFLT